MAKITRVDHIGQQPAPPWSIDGIVSGLTLIWGEPGMGKSFVAIAMSASISTGRPFLGRKTREGPVVYIAGEGGLDNMGHRFRTALAEWSLDPEEDVAPIHVVTPGVDLVPGPSELGGLLGDAKVLPQAIVVDTLSRCFIGDENKQEFMGKFVRSLDLLRDYYHCDVIVIHHANKSHELRGSSVLYGAVDVAWHLTVSPGPQTPLEKRLVLKADKLRERPSEGVSVRMRAVPRPVVGYRGARVFDEYGDLLTTLVVKPSTTDLQNARKVRDIGLAMLEGNGTIRYDDWLKASHLDKAHFNGALSYVVTYPGKWGLMRGLEVGTFVQSVEGVENVW